jgi:lipopolysaccharide export system permease protein
MKMLLFQVVKSSYISKDVLATFGGVLAILLLIALSAQMVGLFNKVASGQLTANVVLITLGLKSISIVSFILPLAFFLGILLSFSRFYQDSEMTALFAAGIGPFHVLGSVLSMAVLVAALQALLSLQLAPWAEEQAQRIGKDAAAKSGIKGLTPGRFREMESGIGVIYAEVLDESSNRLLNIFVQKREGNKHTIIKASSGYEITKDNNNRYVILENGYRYEGQPGQEGYTIIGFKKHGLLIEQEPFNEIELRKKAVKSSVLWNSDNLADKAELQWRISSALLCITLAMLAVPLSQTTPRQGRYAKLVLAIIFYLVFSNLLSVARTWLFQGDIPHYVGLWWVHGLILTTAMLFLMRHYGLRYFLRYKFK